MQPLDASSVTLQS